MSGRFEVFCRERRLDIDRLLKAGVREVLFRGRPALRYPTPCQVDKIKFLDREKPKYSWAGPGGCACWYGLRKAKALGGSLVYLVNGEPAVWACTQEKVPAVCLCVGEGAVPTPELVAELHEAGFTRVLVVFDVDEAGRTGARRVVAALRGDGLEASALELPSSWGEGGDVDDFHRLHGSGLATALSELPVLHQETDQVGVLLSDVELEQVSWLWQGRIPLGKITVLDGDPGLGKSTLALDLAARVTRGAPMPDGSPGVDGGVVILTAEDGLADTVRPRLDAAGGDPTRALAVQTIGTGETERGISLADLQALEQAIRQVSAKLVIVDPVMAFLGAQTDSHRDQDIRRCLAPIASLAERTGAAFLIIRHLNKAAGGNPIYRGGGSIGIIGAARSGFLVSKDPDDEAKRVLASTKSNLSRPPDSLSFELEECAGAVRVKWLGASKHSASSLLAEAANEQERAAVDEAKDFLRDYLADGPQGARDVQHAARQAVISEATLRRAKVALGVKPQKVGRPGTRGQRWLWALPEDDHPPPKMLKPDEMSTFDTSTAGKGRSGNGSAEDAQCRVTEHLRGHTGEESVPPDPHNWGEV